jgi:hypothetical protein
MQELHPISDALLDRLADGELGPDEERQLLAVLENAPGGWRRCALAFVEAQAWRRALSAIAAEEHGAGQVAEQTPMADGVAHAARHACPSPRPWTPRASSLMALAASLLFAFAAGWLLPQAWRGDDGSAADVARSQIARPDGTLAGPSAPVAEPGFDQAAWPEVLDPSQVMTVVVRQPDGSTRPLLVPLLDEHDASRLAGGIAEAGFSSVLPESVRRQLERAGYRVEQRRRYAPLALESGSRLIVPVEDTQIVPVRAGVY